MIFVQHFGNLYGKNTPVFNVHNLVHLADDAYRYGSLDKISAFPFENFLQKLKSMVRKPSFPIQQVIRSLSEGIVQKLSKTCWPILKGEHRYDPVPEGVGPCSQYSHVQIENYCITLKENDRCVRVNDKICIVRNILKDETGVFLVFQSFLRVEHFFKNHLNLILTFRNKLRT